MKQGERMVQGCQLTAWILGLGGVKSGKAGLVLDGLICTLECSKNLTFLEGYFPCPDMSLNIKVYKYAQK